MQSKNMMLLCWNLLKLRSAYQLRLTTKIIFPHQTQTFLMRKIKTDNNKLISGFWTWAYFSSFEYLKYPRRALIVKTFTLSAACSGLRDSLLNVNLLLEAFCIFTISNVPSVFQKICCNLKMSVSWRIFEGSSKYSPIIGHFLFPDLFIRSFTHSLP